MEMEESIWDEQFTELISKEFISFFVKKKKGIFCSTSNFVFIYYPVPLVYSEQFGHYSRKLLLFAQNCFAKNFFPFCFKWKNRNKGSTLLQNKWNSSLCYVQVNIPLDLSFWEPFLITQITPVTNLLWSVALWHHGYGGTSLVMQQKANCCC